MNYPSLYTIGGVTLEVTGDLPVAATTFSPKFASFSVETAGDDLIRIHHHLRPLDDPVPKNAEPVWSEGPWTIYRLDRQWLYYWDIISSIWSRDFSQGDLYHKDSTYFTRGGLASITGCTTDQVFLAPALAQRKAAIFHSTAFETNGNGLICIGHSEAGKSTLTRQMEPFATILCDDRNIIRADSPVVRVYGTWSHGDIPIVNPGGGELKGLMFIRQSPYNKITPILDRSQVINLLLETVIRGFAPRDWWDMVISTIEVIANKVPAYTLEFDLSGNIAPILLELMS